MHEASLVAHAMAKMAVRDVRLLREIAEVVSSVGYKNMAPLDVWRTARAFSYLFYATPPKEEPLRPSRDRMCQVRFLKSDHTNPRHLRMLLKGLQTCASHTRVSQESPSRFPVEGLFLQCFIVARSISPPQGGNEM